MALDIVETLCDLVSIPSVNPMGRDVSGDEYLEHKVTNHLQSIFEKLGVPWHRQTVAPLRDNIVARLDGDVSPADGGQIIMFEAHQDTVPVEGMIIPPWTPTIKDNRIYGRGSCDIKGGMATMLAAFSRLAEERPAGMPTIIMACSVNEEHGFSGASQMSELWSKGLSDIFPKAPDAVIVAEPTLLNVVVAHKGVVRWHCRTSGRAAHSSRPDMGDSAIYRMARVLTVLEDYAQNVVGGLGQHPLCGTPTLSVGVIKGGISVNTVPDDCSIEIDRRVLPGEDPDEALKHVIDHLSEKLENDPLVQHETPFISKPGLADDNNDTLAQRLGQTIQAAGGPGERIGVPYGTDGPAFSATGVPTVVFGPGSIDQAHTCDEWVAIEQLKSAAEIYYQFGRSGM